MPEDRNPPRPHGDKLERAIGREPNDPEANQAQVQSDAPPDAVGSGGSDRDKGRGSTANGIPAFDEDEGAQRKRQHKDGADLVSGTD